MKLISVPYIDQSLRYPTGCESVSTVMLLQYLGYSISVDEFIEQYLAKRDFEMRGSELYGPDPNRFFCGSPYDENSFGCYAPVICDVLRKITGGRYHVSNETGTPMQVLLHDYIDRGMPVIFWACINLCEPVEGPSWRLLDSGKPFTWISNEHCMLLVGYDDEGYYFNDPYDNNGVIRYPGELVEMRHAAQYQMAVGLKPAR